VTDASRLSDILERIDRIERATVGGKEEFFRSEVIQDAVVRNLEVIGETSKNLSPTMRRRYREIPWNAMARFRDLAIHHYGHLLAEEVWVIVSRDLVKIRRRLSETKVGPG